MKRLLVRLPNWVGDVIMATPLLRALRRFLPEATIDLLGRPTVRPLVEGLPYFDELLAFERSWHGRMRLVGLLRRRSYDCALILPHSLGAAWPVLAAGVPRRIGYNRYAGQRWLLTDPLPVAYDEQGRFVPTPMHEHYLGLLRFLGGPADADLWPVLPLGEVAHGQVQALCARHGLEERGFVVVNPGASYGSSKRWTAEGFAAVADGLARETGLEVAIVGGPGEAEFGRDILRLMQHGAIDLCEPPLPLDQLYALIARSAMLVTVDSGPRHMAVAARRPVVVVMGPTDPRYTAVCLDHTAVVRREGLYCLGCHHKNCPTEHECMRMLSPDRVLDAALGLWRQTYERGAGADAERVSALTRDVPPGAADFGP